MIDDKQWKSAGSDEKLEILRKELKELTQIFNAYKGEIHRDPLTDQIAETVKALENEINVIENRLGIPRPRRP